MKSWSSRLKVIFIITGLFLVFYFARHYIFATAIQKILSSVSKEKFEYKKRVWENGSLIYEDAVIGDPLHVSQLRLTPEFTLFPLHLALEVYFTQPQFRLLSQTESPFNLALFIPTKWISFKLDIEHGTLSIDEEPLGLIDFVSGQEPTTIGSLILSEEEGSPYCSCKMSYRGHDLYYELSCEAAPVLHLQSFMSLFTFTPPLQLEGGRLDADLKGTFSSSIQGSLTGSDLQFATSQGEFDFRSFKLQGQWGETLSIEGHVEGGRFINGSVVIDEAHAQISFQPEKAPLLLVMKGRLGFGAVQGPFTCEAQGGSPLQGKLQFSGLDIPFSISYEDVSSIVHADFNNVPLPWLKAVIPFEEGLGSAQVTAFFENKELTTIELNQLHLALIKVKEFSCNSIQGQAVIHDLNFIKEASLKIENLSYHSDFFTCKGGTGTIALAENQFISSQLEGMINDIPG
ncbi:MAG: hypothetical protein ACRDF4_03840, partial [Rhabdochlamydiaceae bacterium]